MSDDPKVVTADHEEAVAGKEETASASELLHGMLKTSKAFRMYLPNNPLLHRFVEETCSRTTEHIGRYGDYRVDVEQFELKYRGNRIYESRDPKESVAFRMFSDGIRSLSFSEGIDSDEICAVLDILGRDRLADSDDDIVTLLWMKDLPHVSYVLTDEILSMDLGGVVFAPSRSQGESIRKVYEEVTPSGAVPVHRELHVLTPEEAAMLRAEREAEEKRNAHQEITTIVSSILAGENEPGIVTDFLAIMENLISNLIRARQPAEALRLIRFLRKMEQSERVPEAKKELVRAAAGSGITPETVLALLPSLDAPDGLSADDVSDFLAFFGSRHVGPVCELLAKVQQMKIRKAILAGLMQIGKDAPAAFVPFLTDQRWFLVRNIVFILGHIGTSESIDPVLRVATHSDLRVRKEVLAFLQKMPEPRARMGLVRFLHDENVHLRIRAIQILAAVKFPPAVKALEAMEGAKDFLERPLQERRAVYEALGDLAGDSLLPRLRAMLKKRLLMGRAREKDDVTCAVAALRKMATPAAVRLLEEAEGERAGTELGFFIEDALRAIRSGKTGQQ
jgi:HEAT repeat protein